MRIGIFNLQLKHNRVTSQAGNINKHWNYAKQQGIDIIYIRKLSLLAKWMLHQSGGKHDSESSCSLSHIISVITLVYVGYVYKTLKNKRCHQ